jgi:hypothetical protein
MPPRLARAEVKRWIDAVVGLLVARSRADRARHVAALGALVGHAEGCFRYRIWWFRWNAPAGARGT